MAMNERMYYSQEAADRANRERAMAALLFLGFGVAVGMALATLFAPKSGEKTRRELAERLGGSLEEGREATNAAVKKLEKEVASLRKRVEERVQEAL